MCKPGTESQVYIKQMALDKMQTALKNKPHIADHIIPKDFDVGKYHHPGSNLIRPLRQNINRLPSLDPWTWISGKQNLKFEKDVTF
jgi:hypothetical protein